MSGKEKLEILMSKNFIIELLLVAFSEGGDTPLLPTLQKENKNDE